METMVETPKKLNKKEIERQEAIQSLLKYVKPGDTVYAILRHVSRSGMMRHISLKVHTPEGMQDITYLASKVLDDRIADDGGIKVGGCGMDMGFHLVYGLSYRLFRDQGFKCIGENCPANDHANPPYPKRKVNGMVHSDAGYALMHSWL